MKKNDEYDVYCTDLSDQGAGICKVDEEVVFVFGLLPNERAKIKIIKVYSRYAIGRLLKLEKESGARQIAPCPVAKWCGGCQLQIVKYEAQCEFKDQWMARLFKQERLYPILKAKEPLFYRNKAQFPIQLHDGARKMGFYKRHSNEIVDTNECLIQNDGINRIYSFLYEHLDEACARGLRHVFIRCSLSNDQVQVVWIGREKTREIEALSNSLRQAFPNIVSIVFNYNERKDNVILGEDYEVLYGSDSIIETCLGNEVVLHFKSFFQVNPKQMEVLYQRAIELAGLQKGDRCIELYAGTGTIGMAVSKYVKEVIGVEIVKEAVENANENARRNGIENCCFVCEDASKFVKKYTGDVDVLFVDPPRKGLSEEGIEQIHRLSPNRVVYISCNPNTLKRDIERFREQAYDCVCIQPVDMFPYTSGIESIALLCKK